MASSHLDALCHVFVDGRMYNGFPGTDVKSTGAKRNSVMCAKDGIVSRGVLLDMPRTLGVPWLEPGQVIDPDQLDAAEARQGVKVRRGDILLVEHGSRRTRAKHGPWSPFNPGIAGLHPECIPWLRERDVAVLGCDCISDVLPPLGIEGWTMPIHQVTLVAMGVHLLDNLHLGDADGGLRGARAVGLPAHDRAAAHRGRARDRRSIRSRCSEAHSRGIVRRLPAYSSSPGPPERHCVALPHVGTGVRPAPSPRSRASRERPGRRG